MYFELKSLWLSTPLHLAAYRGHNDIVTLLVKRGAGLALKSIGVCRCKVTSYDPAYWGLNINPDAHPPWTPLHLAICGMNLSTAKLILGYGTLLSTIIRFQRRQQTHAVRIESKLTCDKWLAVKQLRISMPNFRGPSVYCHHICLSRNCGLLSYAIDMQLVWIKTGTNRSLIHVCLQDPRVDLPPWRDLGCTMKVPEVRLPKYALPWFEYLLNRGADVEAKDAMDCNATAIMVAALHSIEPAMDLLIQHGANVHAKDAKGFTALHAACISSKPEIITKLIDEGAQVDAINFMGDSPLSFICRSITAEHPITAERHNEILKIIQLLLTRGANPMPRTRRNTRVQSALEVAFCNQYLAAVRLIISISSPTPSSGQIWRLFVAMMEAPDPSRVRLLLMLDKRNFILRSDSALVKLLTSNEQTTEAAMILLEKGAPCDARSVFWIVHLQKGNDLLRKVLERGITPNFVMEPMKRCPLLEALAIREVVTRRAYVKSLMEHGADINMYCSLTNDKPIYVDIISPSLLPHTETVLDVLFHPNSFQRVPESQQVAFMVSACRLTHVRVLQKLLESTTGSVIQKFVQRIIGDLTATTFISQLFNTTAYSLTDQMGFTVEHMDIAIDILDILARYDTFWSFQPSPGSARAIDALKNLMAVTRNFPTRQMAASFCLGKRVRIVDSSAESPQVLILPRADSNEYPQGHITLHYLGATLHPTLDGR
ncbi:ankyrin repeat-containing domain protein [Daldinia vernicosa]|uniref:ankyrin repeat-containing domain protein n=1 Tax=Daldinia vernicosa TaxID=114800 RepID=UPI0020074BD0|nr:ankyrin repeat-containing domain protein [Daldinia vernicosa]KAI0847106.1 ankyrin repeat-containing domain protein [Daldinia vernicosa]